MAEHLKNSANRQTFRALNGLRFFAALAILSFHYLLPTTEFHGLPRFAQNLTVAGPVSLGFFFILSGFVLAHAYQDRMFTRTARKSFWLARIVRLYPAYLTAFLLFFPIAVQKYLVHGTSQGVRTFAVGGVLSLLAVQAWTPLAQAWNGPGWSLSVEAFFYFLFPLIIGRIRAMPVRTMLFLISFAWALMLGITCLHEAEVLPQHMWVQWVETNPLFWTPLFLVGIAAYRFQPWWSTKRPHYSTLTGIGTVICVLLLCGSAAGKLTDFLINGGAAPLLVLIVLAFSHPIGAGQKALGVKPLYIAGGLSYIAYILQAPLWHIFLAGTNVLQHHSLTTTSHLWQFCTYTFVLFLTSYLVQRYVEHPAQSWIQARRKVRVKTASKNKDLADPGIEAV